MLPNILVVDVLIVERGYSVGIFDAVKPHVIPMRDITSSIMKVYMVKVDEMNCRRNRRDEVVSYYVIHQRK